MKKIIVCIVAIMFVFGSCAFATTQEELIDIINQARLELTQYYPPVANGTVLYEDENVKMTATSDPYFEKYWDIGDDYGTIYIDVVIENYTDKNIQCSFSEVAINGWTLDGYSEEVMASKKVKGSVRFDYITDTDLTSPEEIQTIEGVFMYYDDDTWDNIGEGSFYWVFN